MICSCGYHILCRNLRLDVHLPVLTIPSHTTMQSLWLYGVADKARNDCSIAQVQPTQARARISVSESLALAGLGTLHLGGEGLSLGPGRPCQYRSQRPRLSSFILSLLTKAGELANK